MHRKTIEQIFSKLQTGLDGLTETEAKKRLKIHGKNEIKVKKKMPLILQFLGQFKDLMVIILIIAALIAGIAGETKDAAVIFFIVVLNAIIGFVQEYKAERAIEALKKLVSPQARVIRNGQEKFLNAKLLVPGDLIILAEGDKISADSRLIEEYELRTQEATLTGESRPVPKTTEPVNKKELHLDEHENMVFMGTNIAHGTGKAIVIRTGMQTEFGKIAHLTAVTKKGKSPLQKELFKIGVFVGKITLVISALLFIVSFFWQGKEFIDTFLFATAVAVAAVPEGLPATITISLALGVQRLVRRNAIVKQLTSIETLGSTTVICSDKTGTLTKNEMTVKQIEADDCHISITGTGYNPKGALHIRYHKKLISLAKSPDDIYDEYKDFTLKKLQSENKKIFGIIELISKIQALCNNAKLIQDKDEKWFILGDPTEGALLTCTEKAGFDLDQLNKANKRIHEFPFDSTRKLMSIITKDRKGQLSILTKGAPINVLNICNKCINNKGKIEKLTKRKKEEILKKNGKMARKALRIIALAYKPTIKKKKYKQENEEKDLIFVGLVGMIDPPRPEVKDAVELTKKAGIKTYVVTGDDGLTAQAIAKQLGIVKGKPKIITGEKLEKISKNQLEKIFQKYEDIIFARVSPEHKIKIVSVLKRRGEIVAVTGDGVNDAPALKRSDIGISMGITGTDVSKEAANMVLADDSYSTIAIAIKEGRTIYENLKKFIFYIFSCNIGELFTVFTAIIIDIPAPLTAILILCVDLGTDVLPALALGIDPPEAGIMEQKPRNPKDRIMKKEFIKRFTYLGIVIGIIVVGLYIFTLKQYGFHFGDSLEKYNFIHLKASTMAFTVLVFIQMANAFNSRSEKYSIFSIGLFSNKWLLGAIAVSICTVLLLVEIPFFQNAIHTTHLSGKEWLTVIVASLGVIVVEEIRKRIRKYKYGFKKPQNLP